MTIDFLVLDEEAAATFLPDFTANPGVAFWESRFPLRWFPGPGLIEDWANGHFRRRFEQAPAEDQETLLPGIWSCTVIQQPDVQFLLECCVQDLRSLRLSDDEKDQRLSSNLHRLLVLLLEAHYQNLPLLYWP